MIDYTDKVVIITGGGSGLGRAAAAAIAKQGGKLVLVDMSKEGLDESKTEISATSPNAQIETVEANVTNEDEVKNYVNFTLEKFGKIDGFFNNAGIEGKQNLTENYGTDEFEKVINVNLKRCVLRDETRTESHEGSRLRFHRQYSICRGYPRRRQPVRLCSE